jgi:hypothetical protein
MDRRTFLMTGAVTPVVAACGGSVTSPPEAPLEVKFHRDAMGVTDGTPGFVKAAVWTSTAVGINDKYFEWNDVAILANHANQGENCARYSQANARGKGATWAGVSEVCDETYGSIPQPLVSHEFDVWAAGPDYEGRVGVHVVLGDSRVYRGTGSSQSVLGTDAIRISSNQDYAKWRVAINVDTVPEFILRIKPESVQNGRIPVLVGNKVLYLRLEE